VVVGVGFFFSDLIFSVSGSSVGGDFSAAADDDVIAVEVVREVTD
jgi:hypothetical protein